MPQLREVDVADEAKALWVARGGAGAIEEVLSCGAVALIDAAQLVSMAESGGTMLPRQALPDSAFISLSELQAAQNSFLFLRVVCVSHCWLQPDHPDPRGHNLRVLGRALKMLVKSYGRFAVFLVSGNICLA